MARAVSLLWAAVVVGSLDACGGNFAFPDFEILDGLSLQVRTVSRRASLSLTQLPFPPGRLVSRALHPRLSLPPSLTTPPHSLPPPLPACLAHPSAQGVANRTQSWLRLTPSVPNLVGSAWHRTKQAVAGGFRTDFTFRIILDDDQAIPGPCKWVDHTPGSCARRGGDGLAFVVQNYGPQSLGSGGGGMGYAGVPNAVAVELDTWFDASLRDPYENHLAVLTRGKSELRAEHGSHLGVCLDVPDLADGEGRSSSHNPPVHSSTPSLLPSFTTETRLSRTVRDIDTVHPLACPLSSPPPVQA